MNAGEQKSGCRKFIVRRNTFQFNRSAVITWAQRGGSFIHSYFCLPLLLLQLFSPTRTLKLHCLQKQRHPEEQLLSYAFAHLPTATAIQINKMCIARCSVRHEETSKEFQGALIFVSESGWNASSRMRLRNFVYYGACINGGKWTSLAR
jgi:hypothetical protein